MSILIVGKRRGTTEVLDDAENRKEADEQKKFWKKQRPGWTIKTESAK